MNKILKKLTEGATDAGSLARSITASGIHSVSEAFQGTKLFSALSASSDQYVEYDETHYLLVPLLQGNEKFAIYTKRILPPDIGATNALPKARIFHVPNETAKETLEQKLIANMVELKISGNPGSSEFADALEKLADQIDNKTNTISGGLILIGGAVAIVNPVLGVGIAAKALFPSIGAKASKIGAEYVGNKLRSWNRSSTKSKLQKTASKEVNKLKPTVYSNPILRSLDAISTNPETNFDPTFDSRNWTDQFDPPHYYKVTAEAIREVYQDISDSIQTRTLKKAHIQWIQSLVETAKTDTRK